MTATTSCTTLQPSWMASSSRRSRESSRRRASQPGQSPAGRPCQSGAAGRSAGRGRGARLSLQPRGRGRSSSSRRRRRCGHQQVCWSPCRSSAASGTGCRRRTRACPLASREGWRPGSSGSSTFRQTCRPWLACLACRSRPCWRPCWPPSCRLERRPCCPACPCLSWSRLQPWQPQRRQQPRQPQRQAPCRPAAGARQATAPRQRSRSSKRPWLSSCRLCRAARGPASACPGAKCWL